MRSVLPELGHEARVGAHAGPPGLEQGEGGLRVEAVAGHQVRRHLSRQYLVNIYPVSTGCPANYPYYRDTL